MMGPHDRPVPAHAGQVHELKDFQDCPAVIYDARLKPTMSEPSSVLARVRADNCLPCAPSELLPGENWARAQSPTFSRPSITRRGLSTGAKTFN